MNVVFLDCDGVLNSRRKLEEVYKQTKRPHSGYSYPFDERCMQNLKTLIEEVDAKIVITSSWRKSKEGLNILLKELNEYDLEKSVIGCTDDSLHTKREDEITEYISELNCIPSFIILDDEDMGNLNEFLVRTNAEVGLTMEDVKQAILKLNEQS